ncbi:MAG: hypothetical protein Ta2A_03150 [Treponemataceae bacterium]|nr:MAG: hypothetical protein Ta2A_03150 [Treponemataceae bacterium]
MIWTFTEVASGTVSTARPAALHSTVLLSHICTIAPSSAISSSSSKTLMVTSRAKSTFPENMNMERKHEKKTKTRARIFLCYTKVWLWTRLRPCSNEFACANSERVVAATSLLRWREVPCCQHASVACSFSRMREELAVSRFRRTLELIFIFFHC